jgi:hypothetical protein
MDIFNENCKIDEKSRWWRLKQDSFGVSKKKGKQCLKIAARFVE